MTLIRKLEYNATADHCLKSVKKCQTPALIGVISVSNCNLFVKISMQTLIQLH